jgi:hypothetical protein
MNRFCFGFFFALLGVSADAAAAAPSHSTSSTAASAAPAKPTAKSRASSGTAHRRSAGTASRAPRKPSRSQATPAAKPATAAPAPELVAEAEAPRSDLPPSGASEARVQPAGEHPATAVVKTEAAGQDKGVKTYTFGAQEVEGRLRSPQILYFLRRVRAEFDAEPLGHRSFLLELSDTRRHSALW